MHGLKCGSDNKQCFDKAIAKTSHQHKSGLR
jgi:hypothetical protein